jgi:hypothetical protein
VPALSPTIVSLLEAQQGLVTRRSLLGIDDGPATLRRMVRNGLWLRVDEGLYGPAGVPMTWRRSLMAAVLLAPPGSLISHRALAHLLGVGGFDVPPRPEVSIPRGGSLRRRDVVVHESTDLDLAEPHVIDGIPCTGTARLAVDLGGVVSEQRYRQTIRELQHQHGVTSKRLLHTYLRHKRRGRNGGGALRGWLDRYFDVGGVSESGIELLVLDAILDASLPTPIRQHWVHVGTASYRLDLAYPGLKLCIEVDGRQHRDDPEVRADDLVRQTALEDAGWTVIRIRSWCFATDLAAALLQLRRHLVGS